MKIKWLLAILVLIVFISGCMDQDGDEITPTYNDNALKVEVKIREKEENRRILPDSTIRMVVTLTNQVEDATKNVSLKITNPCGIHISKVDCGDGCICEWPTEKIICEGEVFGQCTCFSVDSCGDIDMCDCTGCNKNLCIDAGTGFSESERCCQPCESTISCYFNGCHYGSVQSLDEIEITFGLKIPSEEQISEMGRDLKPEIMLEYDYSGVSTLYVPIYKYGEKPAEPKKEFTQTTGPIHVDIESDDWVRAGDLFPLYVDAKDVVHSSEEPTINSFTMTMNHADGKEGERCDFDGSDRVYSKDDIKLPLINPLVCTLEADESNVLPAPMVKNTITVEYSYRYRVEKTETIRVQKAFLGIF